MSRKIRDVSTGVWQRGDRYFIARRVASDPAYPRAWDFPGGKVEPGETSAEAMIREFREEVGIIVEPVRELLVHTFPNGYRITVWQVSGDGEPFLGREHDLSAWMTLDELDDLDRVMPSHEVIVTELRIRECRAAAMGWKVSP